MIDLKLIFHSRTDGVAAGAPKENEDGVAAGAAAPKRNEDGAADAGPGLAVRKPEPDSKEEVGPKPPTDPNPMAAGAEVEVEVPNPDLLLAAPNKPPEAGAGAGVVDVLAGFCSK